MADWFESTGKGFCEGAPGDVAVDPGAGFFGLRPRLFPVLFVPVVLLRAAGLAAINGRSGPGAGTKGDDMSKCKTQANVKGQKRNQADVVRELEGDQTEGVRL